MFCGEIMFFMLNLFFRVICVYYCYFNEKKRNDFSRKKEYKKKTQDVHLAGKQLSDVTHFHYMQILNGRMYFKFFRGKWIRSAAN